MRVTVLELPARFGAVEEQLAAVEAALSKKAAGDLVLLPEAALTGYLPDPSAFAEPRGGATELRLAELCRRFKTLLVGPLIEREGDRVFNAVVGPGLYYRKRNPWYLEAWATAGAEAAPVVTVSGLRVTVCICFDVHFLEGVEADVLLFPSAWVDDDGDARATLLPELARRFNVAVVNANWGVGSPRVPGQGGSMVVAKDGRVLARCRGKTKRLDVDL